MKKAIIKDGKITLPIGYGLSVRIEDLSPDRPQVVADALEEAYRHGHMDGANRVSRAADHEVNKIRNGDKEDE